MSLARILFVFSLILKLDYTCSESTSNAFVAFQIVSAVRETTLREWSIFDAQTIQSIWQYLMQYVTSRSE
jgi:hypothetical protein